MTAIPVVFVHGLWLHASSWTPWLELFSRAGYEPIAPLWPGEHETVAATRADPGSLGARGIDDVAEHLAGVIAALPAPPVLIGHSFGGMLVEKLLAQGRGRAGIAIDAAQIKGVLPLPLSALRSAFPVLRDPANKHRAVSLTADQFHYAFGNAIDRAESDRLYERWAIAAPGRPLFEAAAANVSRHSPAAVDTRNNDRGPLLLVMGGKDHTVPESITKSTARQYRHSTAVTDVVEYPDRGHSLVIDSGWRDVAEGCLTWLDAHEL